MIRLCSKIIKEIDILQVDDEIGAFFDEHGEEGVVVVRESEKIRGIITYVSSLEAHKEGVQIQRERILMNKNIFEEAHKLFDSNKRLVLLPVFYQDQIICFCYDNKKKSYVYYSIDKILTYYKAGANLLPFRKIYPKVKSIKLNGFNEWTLCLYKIFKKIGLSVDVEGEMWKYVDICSDNRSTTDMEIFTVFGEGTSELYQQDVYKEFHFLVVTASIDKLDLAYQLKEKYNDKFDNFYVCLVPTFHDLCWRSLEEEIRHKLGISPIIDSSVQPFDDVFSDLFRRTSGMEPEQWLKNKKQDEINFSRLTLSINGISALKMGNGKNIVYLIGPCIVSCMGVMVNESLMAYVYSTLNKAGLDYSVIAIPCESWNSGYLLKCFENISIKSNDFVFIIEQNINTIAGQWKSDIDLLKVFNSRNSTTWFYDEPIHTNKHGNRKIADCLYEKIMYKGHCITEKDCVIQKGESLDEQSRERIRRYIDLVRQQLTDIPVLAEVGAIVMNCNPFTLGHRHLIEYALEKVDYVLVFVLKEDRSFFSFEERYRQVKECTKDLKRVKVFSSGDFIISLHTFPAYFRKESYQDIYADACMDAQIFADYIVPGLNIKARFVGEEPTDKTTRAYNEILHRTLENAGVRLYEIPRLENAEGYISGSTVRQYYIDNNWEKIKEMVPQYVYESLFDRKDKEKCGLMRK